jgi:ABC-type transport system involved in multi-copper enzyme maturation permease subunit
VKVAAIALDLLNEARQRRWFLLLGIAVTLVLVLLAATLRLEVVDGMLAATSLFGQNVHTDLQAADLAMRPLFGAVSYTIFYGGLAFGILACADFGPSLLSPGRIEHLLALPVRRWELLLGTFLGVLALAALGAVYGAGGVSLILAVKTGVWTVRPVLSALLASVTFSAVYGAMLTMAVFVRSAALSAATGGALFISGIVAGHRSSLLGVFQAGWGRALFNVFTFPLPRISKLADGCATLATSQPLEVAPLVRLLVGIVAFGAACLAVGIWHFEQKDY